MSKISIDLKLLELDNFVFRYEEMDEEIIGFVVCDSLPETKQLLRNRLTLLLTQVDKLKLKDIK